MTRQKNEATKSVQYCNRCRKWKKLIEFSKSKPYCRSCVAEMNAEYHKSHPETQEKYRNRLMIEGYYMFGQGAITSLKQQSQRQGIKFNLTVSKLTTWWRNHEDVCWYCGLVHPIRIDRVNRFEPFRLSNLIKSCDVCKATRNKRIPADVFRSISTKIIRDEKEITNK